MAPRTRSSTVPFDDELCYCALIHLLVSALNWFIIRMQLVCAICAFMVSLYIATCKHYAQACAMESSEVGVGPLLDVFALISRDISCLFLFASSTISLGISLSVSLREVFVLLHLWQGNERWWCKWKLAPYFHKPLLIDGPLQVAIITHLRAIFVCF